MKLIASVLVCMFVAGCGADDRTNTPVPTPRPVEKTFLGLEIGAPSSLPECARYPDAPAPYLPAVMQPVTPCSMPQERVFDIHGVELKREYDYPWKIVIYFHPEQVPVGLEKQADAIIQAGKLAEVKVQQSVSSTPEDRETFMPLLKKRYGPIAGSTFDQGAYWHQPNMDVIYFRGIASDRSVIIGRSPAYREWLQRTHYLLNCVAGSQPPA